MLVGCILGTRSTTINRIINNIMENTEIKTLVQEEVASSMEEVTTSLKDFLGNDVVSALEKKIGKETMATLHKELAKSRSNGFQFKSTEDERVSFAKAFMTSVKNQTSLKSVINTETDTEGGYGVSGDVFNDIVKLTEAQPGIQALCYRAEFSGGKLSAVLNTEDTLLGEIKGELGNYSLTAASFKPISITKKDWGAILGISNSMMKRGFVDFANYIMEQFARGLALRIEKEIVLGGTYAGSPFVGLFNTSADFTAVTTTGVTSLASMTYEALVEAIAELHDGADANGAIVLHKKVLAKLKQIQDGSGAYLFQRMDSPITLGQPFNGPTVKGYIEGLPVFTSRYAPSNPSSGEAFAFVGDLKQAMAYGVDTDDVDILSSQTATVGDFNAFTADATLTRGTAGFAVAPWNPEAGIRLTLA